MTFRAPSYIPDVPLPPEDASIPEFLFGEKGVKYGQYPKEKAMNPFTDGLTGRTFTSAEYQERYELLARALAAELDIKPDEGTELEKVIGTFSYNTIDTMAVSWATHSLGGVACQISQAYNVPELKRQLGKVECKAIFTCVPLVNIAIEAAEAVGLPRKNIYLMELPEKILDGAIAPPDLKTVDQLVEQGKSLSPIENFKMSEGEGGKRIAFLCSSSGTSGLPKSVMISHRNIIANVMQMTAFESGHKGPNPDIGLGVLPLSHIYGLLCVGHQGTFRGDNNILLPNFDLIDVLETIQKNDIARTWLVPPMMVAMVKALPICKKYDLTKIRHVVTGALPIPEKIMNDFSALMKTADVVRVYGLTEASAIVTFGHPSDLQPSSVGNLMPGITARLVTLDGEEITDYNTPGNLLISCEGSDPLGYLNNPEATAETMPGDGWVRTGDLAEFRKSPKGEDHLYIVDRVKEMIKVRGLQVAPTELEGWLVRQPTVKECCVVSIPSDTAGEHPLAFVVRTENTKDQDENEVKAALHKSIEENFAEYKRLAGGIEFIEGFPKSQSGKVLRGQMKQKAREVAEARKKPTPPPKVQSFEFSDSDDSDEESDDEETPSRVKSFEFSDDSDDDESDETPPPQQIKSFEFSDSEDDDED